MRRAVILSSWLSVACTDAPAEEPQPIRGWRPGQVLAGQRSGPRGQLDLRGLIHAHSVYSHDACDGEPRDESDAIDATCLEDFRRGLCEAAHDFVMLTDHDESFSRSAFPEVLLHEPDQGDALVERGGDGVASWMRCGEPTVEDGPERVLVTAGNEAAVMPVGLDRHVAATEEERNAIYGEATTESIAAMREAGAVVLAQHTEDWTAEQIVDVGFDGFEMYNLHANTIAGAGGVIDLIAALENPDTLPHPDLVLLPILNEDERYLSRWSAVLARGHRAVTTIGTDCHQNTFPQMLADGERVDSYRRTMIAMSNHLLVEPEADGSWDDRHLEEALAAGRLYGVFELFGYPSGFDFHAESDGLHEMGAEVSLADGVTLVGLAPTLRNASPDRPAPRIRLRLLRATEDGWEIVAQSEEDIRRAITVPGAYRLEVRITPLHLADDLKGFSHLAERELPWIYTNAIHVVE